MITDIRKGNKITNQVLAMHATKLAFITKNIAKDGDYIKFAKEYLSTIDYNIIIDSQMFQFLNSIL